MDSNQLKPYQADKIIKSLAATRRYISRLRSRMEQTSFPPDDELFLLVAQVQGAMQNLFVKLHYLSCTQSGGRRRPHQP